MDDRIKKILVQLGLELRLLAPELVKLHRNDEPAGGLPLHSHDRPEIRIFLRGGQSSPRPAAIDLTPARVRHRTVDVGDLHRVFSLLPTAQASDSIYYPEFDLPVVSPHLPALLAAIDRLTAAESAAVGEQGEFLLLLSLTLLTAVPVAAELPETGETARWHEIDRYIRSNYFRAGLSVSGVARALSCSVRTVQAAAVRATGGSCRDHIIRVRLDNARRLLLRREYLIKEVAMLCGWSTPQYFSLVFRARCGVAPGDFGRPVK